MSGEYPMHAAVHPSHSDGEVKRKIIDAASGDTTIVAAVTGRKIRVLSFCLVAAGELTARFESTAGGTALTGVMALAANAVLRADYQPSGHFETAAGALLSLELSASTADGWITYQEVE